MTTILYCKKCGHPKVDHSEKGCCHQSWDSVNGYNWCSCKLSYKDVISQHSKKVEKSSICDDCDITNPSCNKCIGC